MQDKRLLRSAVLCGWMDYLQWLRNPRMILLGVLFVYMYTTVLEPMFLLANKMSVQLGWFEPYVAVCNNGLLVLLLPLTFLVLIADFPRVEPDTAFRVFRAGRISWMIGQVLMLILASATVIGLSFIVCTLCSLFMGAQVTFLWSDAIEKTVSHSIIQNGDLTVFLPSNLFYQVTLGEAVIDSLVLTAACCVTVGLVMLALCVWNVRKFSMLVGSGSIVLGYVLLGTDTDIKWIMPTAHFVLKEHFSAYFSTPNMPVYASLAYFAGVCLLACLTAGRKIRSYHFISSQETFQ